MLLFTITYARDDHLGRVDHSALSAQQRMEILVSDISPDAVKRFQDSDGAFLDISKWKGVKCNSTGDPIRVVWIQFLSGTIALDFLPQSLLYFDVCSCKLLHGTLCTSTLPPRLKLLRLHYTAMHGLIDWRNLPTTYFSSMDIGMGNFSGSVDLTALPPKLSKLVLSQNKFTGEINLEHLPAKLEILHLCSNALSGVVSLGSLPAALKQLSLDGNRFIGDLKIFNAPQKLERVSVFGNNFSGTAIIPQFLSDKVRMECGAFDAIFDEKGEVYEDVSKMSIFPEILI